MGQKTNGNKKTIISDEGVEVIISPDFSYDVDECFSGIPEVAKSLLNGAKESFSKIEKMLYTAPSFIEIVKAAVPERVLRAVLSDDQKKGLVSGALKLMTKKDGTLMANLVNPETNKIVSTIPLEYVNHTPALAKAISNFQSQMQMARIAEVIQEVQRAIEEVRQGQENDRLAMAYSCQQKILQASVLKDPNIKTMALLKIASDAEDSRNMLMLSQKANVRFIQEQPENSWKKVFSGANPEKIQTRVNEVRASLEAVNMVSLAEAMAYQEMGEFEAAQKCLGYYATFLFETYLESEGFVQRLDMIDKSPQNYWSEKLPEICKHIAALPGVKIDLLTKKDEDETDGRKTMQE